MRAAFVVTVTLLISLLLHPAAAQTPAQPTAEASARRIALVVGNNNYDHAPLVNPVNDARAMASALQGAGFTVILRLDASQRELTAAVREFGERLKEGGSGAAGLFYFAGHGMQIKGRNFLIPVGASIEHEDEVSYQALDAQAVMDKMESAGNGTNIVILDACRNNPFARAFRSGRQGLAQMDAPVGTLVAFSTAPGSVASDGGSIGNGLYTSHLLRAMQRPGQKVEDVFKQVRMGVLRESGNRQVPWEASSLVGDFYFRAPAEGATQAAAPAPAPDFNASLDDAFWAAVKDSTSSAELFAYLNRFPAGRHAREARARLADLVAPTKASNTAQTKPQQQLGATATDITMPLPEVDKALREQEEADHEQQNHLALSQRIAEELVKWGDTGTNTRKPNPARNAHGFAEGDRYRWRVRVGDEHSMYYLPQQLWRIDRIEPDGSLWINDGAQRMDAFGHQRGGSDPVSGHWIDWAPALPVTQALKAVPDSQLAVQTLVQIRDHENRITRANLNGHLLGATEVNIMTSEGLRKARLVEAYLSGPAARTDGQRYKLTFNLSWWFLPGVGLPVQMRVDHREDDRLVRRTLHEVTAMDVFSVPATVEPPDPR